MNKTVIRAAKKIYHILILPKLLLTRLFYRWKTKYTNTGKIALCCIAKQENEYIRFFVEYYKSLHFDRIIIYDNNEPEGERFEEVIGDYIQSGFVELVDFRGKMAPQMKAYQDAYDRYNKDYDWIAFFDCDEFLTFVDGTDNIHSFLSRELFIPFQVVHFNWMVYGDNEMLDNDGRNVIDRFRNPILPYDFKTQYTSFPENNHVKSIVRGGLCDIKWKNGSHTPLSCYCKCCNPIGVPVKSCGLQEIEYSKAYIRHYSTKTIGEWVKNKMKKGDVFYCGNKAEQMVSIEYFFRYNKRTADKIHYAEMLMKG